MYAVTFAVIIICVLQWRGREASKRCGGKRKESRHTNVLFDPRKPPGEAVEKTRDRSSLCSEKL